MLLYAATSNPGKLREFHSSAASCRVTVEPLPGLDGITAPVEDALTFSGNADLKARAYSLHLPGQLVFADDSGLEVDALDGAPGVRSARFADDAGFDLHSGARTDVRNNALLIERLGRQPFAARTARFRCALSLARDGEVLLRAEGAVDGEILLAPRGTDGFGYDPLFLLPWCGLTLAELPLEEKWSVSHRGQAFRNLLAHLEQLAL